MTVAEFLLAVLLLNVSLLGLYLQYNELQMGTLASPKLQAALSATLAQTLTEVTERLSASSIVTFTPNPTLAAPTTTTTTTNSSLVAPGKCAPLSLHDDDDENCSEKAQAPQGLKAPEEVAEGDAETF
jgi:Tfp pilus assembly protein PilV